MKLSLTTLLYPDIGSIGGCATRLPPRELPQRFKQRTLFDGVEESAGKRFSQKTKSIKLVREEDGSTV